MSEDRQEYGKVHTFRPISERVKWKRQSRQKSAAFRMTRNSRLANLGSVRYKYRQHDKDAVLDTVRPLMATQQLDVRSSIVDFDIATVKSWLTARRTRSDTPR